MNKSRAAAAPPGASVVEKPKDLAGVATNKLYGEVEAAPCSEVP